MVIPSSRQNFEFMLVDWMKEVVRVTHNPLGPHGVAPEMALVATAAGIDEIMHASPSMALGGGGKRTVYAQFLWGGLANGAWYIRGVSFSVSSSQQEMSLAHQRALKEKLLDKAEIENASHVHIKQQVFPTENYVASWREDIEKGDRIIHDYVIPRAYDHAKEEAYLAENPVTPKDLALDMAGGAVKAGKAIEATERVEKLAKVYEGIEKFKSGVETGDKLREAASEETDRRPGAEMWKRTRGDVILDAGIDLASNIPVAGHFVKLFAGWTFDIAIANQSGRITKIRSRAYIFFVGGFLEALTYFNSVHPTTAFDKKFYGLGFNIAKSFSADASFRAQIYLLHYASETTRSEL
ncbi:MAG: hypothetical protein JWO48_808 [Bryobacterales bacterium]|nr:hypothetical protein [Bryobacterales bacterium]